jgi:hypothetical protein
MSKEVEIFQTHNLSKYEEFWKEQMTDATEEEIRNLVSHEICEDQARFIRRLEKMEQLINKPLFGYVVLINAQLWNGKAFGIKKIDKAKDIATFANVDDVHFYTDGYNFRMRGYHHDGTNQYEIRALKTEEAFDRLYFYLHNHPEGLTSQIKSKYSYSLRHYILKAGGYAG